MEAKKKICSPDRHMLIGGDTTKTLPLLKTITKDGSFWLIHVDGGHTYDIAKSDISTSMELRPSYILVDDAHYKQVERAMNDTIVADDNWAEVVLPFATTPVPPHNFGTHKLFQRKSS
jgi:hypothetical protein